jgi:sigma-B regulation protein RsbU (phosphoserine phosphatase)
MRDKLYILALLAGAGLLLYLGRGLLRESALLGFGLTFAGTMAAGVLGIALYRVQLELRASRQELAMKQAELNFAMEVQLALFPREFPRDGGLEFSGICIPARGISGDYYDVIPLPDGRLGIAIADISGKGISAAILMSNLHAVLRTLAAAGCSPDEIGTRLNRHLHQVTQGSRFATLFYAEWDDSERRLCYINAGHNAPILVGEAGVRRLLAETPPLGLFLGPEFTVQSVMLDAGALLVLFSDGVTEAGTDKGTEFGDAQLEALISAHARKPLQEIQQQILATVERWTANELEDDFTLLLARNPAPQKEAP